MASVEEPRYFEIAEWPKSIDVADESLRIRGKVNCDFARGIDQFEALPQIVPDLLTGNTVEQENAFQVLF